ncbi:transglutaminase family protein [Uliginosibacterium aquaticum]|uniref:Transglutaminase family protein n=1 Tax=Uliginosibacterium aquaticum TaxID=2731212 RepID=A0ABX2IBR0_9RHOO|nr:transglutaminase family protein [Uliginosibacterium aquaticum]NSL53900.1 transglutaminase family protein [Uliginosibacterium aquaticum]
MSEHEAEAPIRYHVIHETLYRYAAPVSLSQHLLHMVPRECAFQRVEQNLLEVTPSANRCEPLIDWFGNPGSWLALRQPHSMLRLIAASTVEVSPRPQCWREVPGRPWEDVAAMLSAFPSIAPLDAQECALASVQVPLLEEVREWALASFTPGRPLLEACRHLMGRIYKEFEFDPKASTVATPVAATFHKRRGVCQDFAQLMLCALRSLGLSARYMSGYILTHPAPGKPRLIGADASHAWIAVWCPDNDWVGFDPTNNLQPHLEHVILGWGRDFNDVSPMRGVILGGASHEVEVQVTMMPAETRDFDALLGEVRGRSLEKKAAE